MTFHPKARIEVSEGSFNFGEPIAIPEGVQVYGQADHLHGHKTERESVIRYQGGSDEDRAAFVFALGPYIDDGINIDCDACGRALALHIKDGQIVRVVLVCPDCGHPTPVHSAPVAE